MHNLEVIRVKMTMQFLHPLNLSVCDILDFNSCVIWGLQTYGLWRSVFGWGFPNFPPKHASNLRIFKKLTVVYFPTSYLACYGIRKFIIMPTRMLSPVIWIHIPAAYLLINCSPLFFQLQNRLCCFKLFYENSKYLLPIAFRFNTS